MRLLILFLLLATLTACKPDPRQLLDQARQSLEEGYAYLESDDEAFAMEAFKNAEHYGLLAGIHSRHRVPVTRLATCCIAKARQRMNTLGD